MFLRNLYNLYFLAAFAVIFLISCNNKKSITSPYFTLLTKDKTGINFSNKLTPTAEFNLFSYMYYYNGAGVGAGDFNNDGLIDLFFTANQDDNKLYINEGKLTFKDVTTAAQIPQDKGWSTGVSVVDINADGLLDIYVCKVGHYKVLTGKNQLLICKGINKQGIPYYVDEAAKYGLDFSGFSTQAAFFDYDLDGDLDMFLLNHSVNHDGNYAPRKLFENTFDSLAGQKFYRNDTYLDDNNAKQIHFADVTKSVGINGSKIGYGLGVAVSDINLDGWPDFYVGNDFHENDFLYINKKNGTFLEQGRSQLQHTTQFSMGVDIADINNDAYPEIISMDMLPYEPYMLRRSLAEDDYNIFQQKIKYGYTYQYARNNLQLNRKNNTFSEVGQYAGIHATDWSWAALWMDFDNNGYKDLFVSNGIPKRMNDIDYISFVSGEEIQNKLQSHTLQDKDLSLVNKFPEIKIPNRFFYNQTNLQFKDVSDSIENSLPTFSNGTAYADLDNDGDLDIVVNNINDAVMIYQNKANDNKTKSYTSIKLKYAYNNIDAIGARVIVFANNEVRTYENYPVRGFQSSMQVPLHIGLHQTKVYSAFLIWPDNSFQKITIKPNETASINYEKNLPKFDFSKFSTLINNPIYKFENINNTGIDYLHIENQFNEFDREPLLPHMLSTEGPALAVADINHDGLEDVFVGASKGNIAAIYLQNKEGKFLQKSQSVFEKDKMWEHINAQWIDVNNDNNIDLVIATGGNEYYGKDEHRLPLLYINDGEGNLSKKEDAFNNFYTTQSVLAPYDFNADGFVDIFIGGRTEPWNYGKAPQSALLLNDGTGKFNDVTNQYSKELAYAGMITDAVWVDINNDKQKDLIVCYDWGWIDVFINNKNHFAKKTIAEQKGWWNFIKPIDVNNDGLVDFVAGNFGANNKLKASSIEPVSMYFGDFDDNGNYEQVLTYFINHTEIPFATKQELEKKLPYIKKKYLYAEDFAKAGLTDLFGKEKLSKAKKLSADFLENAILINKGNLQFETIALPKEAQLTSYRDALSFDFNSDSLTDILLVGNYFENNVELGRNDAEAVTMLINKGNNKFEYNASYNDLVKGQVRHAMPINIKNEKAILLTKNNDSLQLIKIKRNQ